MQELIYNDERIICKIDRGKRKNLYIVIKNGEVIIKVPKKYPEKDIGKLLSEKKEWIYINYKKNLRRKDSEKEYIQDEIFNILGEEFKLNIVFDENKKAIVYVKENKLFVTLNNKFINGNEEEIKIEIKKAIEKFKFILAEEYVVDTMEELMLETKLVPINYKVKNLKSSWGLCSSKKEISINKNVVLYDTTVIKYVCLHELCHLKQMNHSKAFWDLVYTFMPDYKEVRKRLRL